MISRRFNWQIWAAFVLSVFGFLSYPLIFVQWPATRDFPWINLFLAAFAAVLLLFGLRRAFAPGRRWPSKIGYTTLATLSVVALAAFVFMAFIAARWLPPSSGAPQAGQKAPDFTLPDINGRPVSLEELRTSPIETGAGPKPPKAVLLVFYRGYW
jgi:hypothetical protein